MADKENIIDRGEAGITALDLLNLNQQSPFTEKLKEAYDVEDEMTQSTKGFIPGIVSSLTTDTAGILNRLIDIPGLNKGDSSLYGPKDYYDTTFGKAHEGEMIIPFDQVKSNPNFQTYLDNMSAMMEENESSQLDKFRKDKGLITEEDWNSYLHDLHQTDMQMNAGVEIPQDEKEEFFKIKKLMTQVVDPRPFRMSEDDQYIIINSDLLPSVPWEPDPKFTEEGYLSLPYGGTYSMRDGELFLEAPSMFRATDELSDTERGIFKSDAGTDYLKKMEDYLYPNLSPQWRYGDTTGDTLSYQAGQLAPGIAGLTKLGVKGAKGLASLYRGAKNKLLQRQPIQAVDYLKMEPYFE